MKCVMVSPWTPMLEVSLKYHLNSNDDNKKYRKDYVGGQKKRRRILWRLRGAQQITATDLSTLSVVLW